jgi:hypothetical protein
MYNKTLSYTVNDPYKAFIELNKKDPEGSDSQLWCTKTDVRKAADTLIAAATENADNYLLQELVETLQLDSNLLSV